MFYSVLRALIYSSSASSPLVSACLFAFRLIVDSHVSVQKAREPRCGTECVCVRVRLNSCLKAAKSFLWLVSRLMSHDASQPRLCFLFQHLCTFIAPGHLATQFSHVGFPSFFFWSVIHSPPRVLLHLWCAIPYFHQRGRHFPKYLHRCIFHDFQSYWVSYLTFPGYHFYLATLNAEGSTGGSWPADLVQLQLRASGGPSGPNWKDTRRPVGSVEHKEKHGSQWPAVIAQSPFYFFQDSESTFKKKKLTAWRQDCIFKKKNPKTILFKIKTVHFFCKKNPKKTKKTTTNRPLGCKICQKDEKAKKKVKKDI